MKSVFNHTKKNGSIIKIDSSFVYESIVFEMKKRNFQCENNAWIKGKLRILFLFENSELSIESHGSFSEAESDIPQVIADCVFGTAKELSQEKKWDSIAWDESGYQKTNKLIGDDFEGYYEKSAQKTHFDGW
jgi:hypothetical protein